VNRRSFITLRGGAPAACFLAARSHQSERVRRVGVLMTLASDDPEGRARIAAFVHELQQRGWSEGHNLHVDAHWPAGDPEATRKNAAELVATTPDVILATASPVVGALQQASRTVPIVFVTVVDPVGGRLC